jgi:hypothetical protein
MPDSDLDLSDALFPEVYHHLLAYQQRQGHPSLIAALNHLLQNYFVSPTESSAQQLEGLESRVYTLTREVMLLRQSVPDQCDRLREQLAAVRLSHSGLLQNLRQRLEVLEGIVPTEDPLSQEIEPVLQDTRPTIFGVNNLDANLDV